MLEEIATPRHAAAIRAEVIGRSWEKVAADVHAVLAGRGIIALQKP